MNGKKITEKTSDGCYKYVILICLCLIPFISMFAQYQMQPMANEIKTAMSLTDSQYSALFTAPMTPAIFISLICGIIVDKVGGRWPMFLSLIVATLGLWGRVFASSYAMLYICIFVLGFAATFGNSSNAKMFGGWFKPEKCSICIGIYMASSAIGNATATSITPLLPSLTDAYIISAVIVTFITVFWFIFYRDGKKQERKQIKTEEDSQSEKKEGIFTTIKIVIKQRDILLAGFADLFLYGALQSINAFLSIILMVKGMTESQAGATSAFVAGGMFIGNLLVPTIVGKIGKLRRTLFTFGITGGLLAVLIAFISNNILLNIILILVGALMGGCVPLMMSVPLRLDSIGVKRTGTAGGLIATFQLFGAVVLPTYVVSRIAAGNYTLFLFICGCLAAVGAILISFLSHNVEVKKYNSITTKEVK